MALTSTCFPDRASARFAQLTLACMAAIGSMDSGIVALLIEPMKRDLQLNDVQVGVANTTVYFVAYGLLSAPFGMIADRISRTRMLLGTAFLFFIALLMTASASSYLTLLVSKALMGAAYAAILPAALSLYADYFPPQHRASATATYPLGQVIGSSAAIFIGGVGFSALSSMQVGDGYPFGEIAPWRIVFFGFALLALLLIPALIALREPPRRERERERGSVKQLWAYRRSLLPLFLGRFFITGLSSGIMTWVAPALMRLYRKQPGEFATWYGVAQLAAGIVGVLLAARLAERARQSNGKSGVLLPAATGALICGPSACMAMAPNAFWFATMLFVFILAYTVTVSVTVIAVTFRVPNELRGLTTGFYVVFSAAGASVTSPFIAQIGATLGGDNQIGRAMALAGVVLALAAAACFWAGSLTSTSIAGTGEKGAASG